MSAPAANRTQKSINYLTAQLELLSQSPNLNLDQISFVYESIANSEYRETWPFSAVFKPMTAIMKDGLDTKSSASLLQALKNLFSNMGRPIGVPFNENEKVIFESKTFCFTGLFELGQRRDCHAKVESLGGEPVESILVRLDYLVIGKYCSPDWKHTKFGRKIERVMELNTNNVRKHTIKIISESFFISHIEGIGKAS